MDKIEIPRRYRFFAELSKTTHNALSPLIHGMKSRLAVALIEMVLESNPSKEKLSLVYVLEIIEGKYKIIKKGDGNDVN